MRPSSPGARVTIETQEGYTLTAVAKSVAFEMVPDEVCPENAICRYLSDGQRKITVFISGEVTLAYKAPSKKFGIPSKVIGLLRVIIP